MTASYFQHVAVLGICVGVIACTSDQIAGPLARKASTTVASINSIPEGYVATPAGLYHSSCVHEIPNGAKVHTSGVVTLASGAVYQIPKCLFSSIPNVPNRLQGDIYAPVDTGWMEFTSASQFGNPFKQITANSIVPTSPPNFYSGQKVYYTFPGLQNDGFIIQPVLQYGYNGLYGGSYWTITSWKCGSVCTHSAPITVSAGHSLAGNVYAYNCSGGNCNWNIQNEDVTTGQATILTVLGDTENYWWATSGAVETYNLNDCEDFPQHAVSYTDVTVYDANYNPETPSWSANYHNRATISPWCGFKVSYTASSVTLAHWAPSIAGTSIMSAGMTCTFTASATEGTPPYTYTWSYTLLNGASGGGYSPSNGSFVLAAQNNMGQVKLSVKATDATGNDATGSKVITFGSSGWSCT